MACAICSMTSSRKRRQSRAAISASCLADFGAIGCHCRKSEISARSVSGAPVIAGLDSLAFAATRTLRSLPQNSCGLAHSACLGIRDIDLKQGVPVSSNRSGFRQTIPARAGIRPPRFLYCVAGVRFRLGRAPAAFLRRWRGAPTLIFRKTNGNFVCGYQPLERRRRVEVLR